MTGEGHPPVRRVKREICSRFTLLDHTTAVRRVSKAQACSFCEFRIQVFGSDHSNVIQVPRKGSCSGDQSEAGLSQKEEAIPSLRRKPKRNRYLWLFMIGDIIITISINIDEN